jgi:serine/threonine protein kinase
MSFAFKSGDIIDNRYKILRGLSSGMLSEGYQVSDLESHSHYFLKIFKKAIEEEFPEYSAYSRKLQERLVDLSISNIVCPIRMGKIDDLTYQVFTYVENAKDLESIIRDSAPFDPEKALGIIRQIANALHELHKHNIVHGDVKPSNILLDGTKANAFLIDFGMVQHIKEGFTEIFGTLKYMHPFLRGHSQLLLTETAPRVSPIRGRVGGYIDIYALGLTALEMLGGEADNRLPLSERQLVLSLQRHNRALNTVESEVLDQLANMIFQMLTVRPDEEGITAHTISSICTTMIRLFQGKNKVAVKTIEPADRGCGERVSEYPQNNNQRIKGALSHLESIAKSLDSSTRIMVLTTEKLEMATTTESESRILEGLDLTFGNALARTRTSWKVGIMMTIISFLAIIGMIFSAVLLTVLTGTASWSLIFGGAGVSTVIGTLIWRPYDRAFRATILAQQLEMIHMQCIVAFRGSTDIEYRVRICREAIDRLQVLLRQDVTAKTRKK